jgi:hypothetical protein
VNWQLQQQFELWEDNLRGQRLLQTAILNKPGEKKALHSCQMQRQVPRRTAKQTSHQTLFARLSGGSLIFDVDSHVLVLLFYRYQALQLSALEPRPVIGSPCVRQSLSETNLSDSKPRFSV